MDIKEKNVGLFFGSFNPITIGHLYVGKTLIEYFSFLDRIDYVVTPQNPYKTKEQLADENDRLHMCNLAIKDFNSNNLYVNDIEFKLSLPTYTYKTINYLKSNYPNTNFYIITGEDVFHSMPSWDGFEYLIGQNIIVYPRNTYNKLKMAKYYLNGDFSSYVYNDFQPIDLNISSTMVRNRVKNHSKIDYLVTDNVKKYIFDNEIYK